MDLGSVNDIGKVFDAVLELSRTYVIHASRALCSTLPPRLWIYSVDMAALKLGEENTVLFSIKWKRYLRRYRAV